MEVSSNALGACIGPGTKQNAERNWYELEHVCLPLKSDVDDQTVKSYRCRVMLMTVLQSHAPPTSWPPRTAHAATAHVHCLAPYPLPSSARRRGKASLAFSSPSQCSAIAVARARSSTLHR
jgi:hypothetical protein